MKDWYNSVLRTIGLAFVLYACTEDSEKRIAQDVNSSVARADVSSQTTDAALATSGSVWNTEVGGSIDYALAKSWIENHKKVNPNGPWSYFYGKSTFENILNYPGAVGISIQYGINKNGTPVLIMFAVNSKGKLLASNSSFSEDGDPNPTPGDMGSLCPTACPE